MSGRPPGSDGFLRRLTWSTPLTWLVLILIGALVVGGAALSYSRRISAPPERTIHGEILEIDAQSRTLTIEHRVKRGHSVEVYCVIEPDCRIESDGAALKLSELQTGDVISATGRSHGAKPLEVSEIVLEERPPPESPPEPP